MSLQSIGDELSLLADENPHQVVEFLVEWLTGDKYWTTNHIRQKDVHELQTLMDYIEENKGNKL